MGWHLVDVAVDVVEVRRDADPGPWPTERTVGRWLNAPAWFLYRTGPDSARYALRATRPTCPRCVDRGVHLDCGACRRCMGDGLAFVAWCGAPCPCDRPKRKRTTEPTPTVRRRSR